MIALRSFFFLSSDRAGISFRHVSLSAASWRHLPPTNRFSLFQLLVLSYFLLFSAPLFCNHQRFGLLSLVWGWCLRREKESIFPVHFPWGDGGGKEWFHLSFPCSFIYLIFSLQFCHVVLKLMIPFSFCVSWLGRAGYTLRAVGGLLALFVCACLMGARTGESAKIRNEGYG